MSKDINKVELSGELGWEPRLDYSSKGTARASSLLVVRDGEYSGKPVSHRIRLTFWGERAEQFVNQGYEKGDRVKVRGKINVRRWKPQGSDQWKEEVSVVVFSWEGEASGAQSMGEELTFNDGADVPF